MKTTYLCCVLAFLPVMAWANPTNTCPAPVPDGAFSAANTAIQVKALIAALTPWETAPMDCPGRMILDKKTGRIATDKDITYLANSWKDFLRIDEAFEAKTPRRTKWEAQDRRIPNWRIIWPFVSAGVVYSSDCGSLNSLDAASYVIGEYMMSRGMDPSVGSLQAKLIPLKKLDSGSVCTYALQEYGETYPTFSITIEPDPYGHLVGRVTVVMVSSVPVQSLKQLSQ